MHRWGREIHVKYFWDVKCICCCTSYMCPNPSYAWDNIIEPSGGVVGLIQRNTNEGRCPLENPSEMLKQASLLLLIIGVMVVVHPVVLILRLGCSVWIFVCNSEFWPLWDVPNQKHEEFNISSCVKIKKICIIVLMLKNICKTFFQSIFFENTFSWVDRSL